MFTHAANGALPQALASHTVHTTTGHENDTRILSPVALFVSGGSRMVIYCHLQFTPRSATRQRSSSRNQGVSRHNPSPCMLLPGHVHGRKVLPGRTGRPLLATLLHTHEKSVGTPRIPRHTPCGSLSDFRQHLCPAFHLPRATTSKRPKIRRPLRRRRRPEELPSSNHRCKIGVAPATRAPSRVAETTGASAIDGSLARSGRYSHPLQAPPHP